MSDDIKDSERSLNTLEVTIGSSRIKGTGRLGVLGTLVLALILFFSVKCVGGMGSQNSYIGKCDLENHADPQKELPSRPLCLKCP
jgi:hypothetical protein